MLALTAEEYSGGCEQLTPPRPSFPAQGTLRTSPGLQRRALGQGVPAGLGSQPLPTKVRLHRHCHLGLAELSWAKSGAGGTGSLTRGSPPRGHTQIFRWATHVPPNLTGGQSSDGPCMCSQRVLYSTCVLPNTHVPSTLPLPHVSRQKRQLSLPHAGGPVRCCGASCASGSAPSCLSCQRAGRVPVPGLWGVTGCGASRWH